MPYTVSAVSWEMGACEHCDREELCDETGVICVCGPIAFGRASRDACASSFRPVCAAGS
jgi:hypothetical protein